MVNASPNTNPQSSNTAVKSDPAVRKEIGVKWGKFSENDLSALKDKEDLVTQVVAKYGLEKAQAQRDVDAMLKGRHF
jgi:hypothetical protein